MQDSFFEPQVSYCNCRTKIEPSTLQRADFYTHLRGEHVNIQYDRTVHMVMFKQGSRIKKEVQKTTNQLWQSFLFLLANSLRNHISFKSDLVCTNKFESTKSQIQNIEYQLEYILRIVYLCRLSLCQSVHFCLIADIKEYHPFINENIHSTLSSILHSTNLSFLL